MKYALDTEFIDTPGASELLSLALVSSDRRELYLEFPYSKARAPRWVRENVLPLLIGRDLIGFDEAALRIRAFIGGDAPEFWAFYASFDWYWLCRVFGGMMDLPQHYPRRPREFADCQEEVPNVSGPAHFALNDARSLMYAMKKRGTV